jgi:Putative beta-barrel porin-2, OmpL-like. bbp2
MERMTGRMGVETTMRAACVAMVTLGLAGTAWAADPPAAPQPAPLALASAAAGAPSPDDPVAPAKEEPQDLSPVAEFFKMTEVSGFVDGYYQWAFNDAAPQLRNFDITHNGFGLSYAEIAFGKPATEASRAGFRLDLGAGDTVDLVNAFEPGGTGYMKYVQQAYVSYLAPVGKGLTIDFGKFVTPAGGEVIENKDNYNYSRGLLFALAIPYYHTGFRVGYAVSDKVSLTGYLVNGWNNVKENNDAKTVGVTVATKPAEKVGLNFNYLVGNEFPSDVDGGTRNLFDVVGTYAATDKVSLLANFDYGVDSIDAVDVNWYGVALGVKYQATEKFAFAPRYEWFVDDDGFATGVSQTLQGITLTGEYKATGGLITRFEFRTDFSDEDFFVKDDGLKGSQPTASVSFIYAFSSK